MPTTIRMRLALLALSLPACMPVSPAEDSRQTLEKLEQQWALEKSAQRKADRAPALVPPVCDVPWTASDLDRAEQGSQRELSVIDPLQKPSTEHSDFVRWNDAWAAYDGAECAGKHGVDWPRERYEKIWLALKRQEQDRAYLLEEQTIRNSFRHAVAVEQDASRLRAARKRGFTEVRFGLELFLEVVRSEAWTEAQMRSVAVIMSDDGLMQVRQVLGKEALVTNGRVRLLVPNDAGRAHEGTSLYTLLGPTVQVTGTRSYQSLGGPRQAFVVRPIEKLEERGLGQAFGKDGQSALAVYAEGRLRECFDLVGAKGARMAPMIRNAASEYREVVGLGSCAQLSRPTRSRCTLPDGSGYAAYVDFEDDPVTSLKGLCQEPTRSAQSQ